MFNEEVSVIATMQPDKEKQAPKKIDQLFEQFYEIEHEFRQKLNQSMEDATPLLKDYRQQQDLE